MKYTKISATNDGGSTMTVEEVETNPVGFIAGHASVELSPALASKSSEFCRAPVGWDGDWHPVPRRQLTIGLSGQMLFEATDGNSCHIGAGDVILFEDTTGKGHFSKVVGDEDWCSVLIALE